MCNILCTFKLFVVIFIFVFSAMLEFSIMKNIKNNAEDQPQTKKIFAKDTSDEALLFKIYKEPLKFNNKANNWLENRPRSPTDISPKNMYRCQVSR